MALTKVTYPDSEKLLLGAGDDLQIYHNGSHSYIDENGTGILAIRSNGTEVAISSVSGESMGRFINDGAVELYYDNSKKLETLSNGVEVTGHLRVQSSSSGYGTNLYDSIKSGWGSGQDLQIYHDGTHSYITNTTGDLKIKDAGAIKILTNSLRLKNADDDETYLAADDDGAVELYYDNVLQTKTTSTGIHFADEKRADFGTGTDLKIFSDGTNGVATAVNGRLYLQSDTGVNFTKVGNAETLAIFNENGSCDLYYDNAKKFETTSGGCTVTDDLVVTNDVKLADDGKLICGGSSDLKIYHNGSHSYIEHSGASGNLLIRPKTGEDGVTIIPDGAVKLAHNDVTKLETTSTGVQINDWITLGSTGGFRSDSAIVFEDAGGNEWRAKFHDNDKCEFAYDNALRLATDANGFKLHGSASGGQLSLYANGSHQCSVWTNTTPEFGWTNNSGNWAYRIEADGDYQHYGSAASDRDRKDNITPINYTSLDKITKLVPKTYNWKQTEDGKTPTDKTFTGFIAQEVKEHLPSLVTGTDGQKNMAVDYNGVLAHAVKAITELSTEVETLKTKVAALEAK